MADQTYKRLEFDQHGKPADVLQVKTIIGIPTPKEDEVVIKVTASPVHPSVLMTIQGKLCYFSLKIMAIIIEIRRYSWYS